MPPDLRAIVRARMIDVHGHERGAMAALAAKVAPRWGVLPSDALSRLSRWLRAVEPTDIKGEQLVHVLDVLGLTIAKREP
jgi:hypothetical protein